MDRGGTGGTEEVVSSNKGSYRGSVMLFKMVSWSWLSEVEL